MTDDLLEDRITHSEDAVRYSMNQLLYGDTGPAPTRWQLFRCRWRLRAQRVRDAWLVLTGKVDIE